ncbi:TetR family transcriptional regulator [Ktedonobacter sp. SOSP1-52]|uniref:TetR/AcrR family transcriptional regulator n=1 Tax=Ktedonobacter sp. SOSP1-52 TaxID=2778366 RepID=UPI001A23E338|nr:TetR/AcrR family transcriptional regulator [Ktedonobacter sp. SOSP1-52]GHO70171.1 TetR family transcriptional regulator [Ktedonobacter sp. SOSP1-52]
MSHRENSKELILERAVQMASVQGLNGLTIGRLAEALSLSKGGICAHFPSKINLQVAAVERAAQIFQQVVTVPALEKASGLPQLQALSDAWFEYLVARTFEGGCFFTNALLEVDDLESNEVREAVRQQYNRFIELVERCARDAVAWGHFRSDLQIHQFAFEFLGIQFSTLAWRGLGRDAEMIAIAKKAMVDLFQRSAS